MKNFLYFIVLTFFLASCSKDNSQPPRNDSGINIHFTHSVNGENFEELDPSCCGLPHKNAAGQDYSVMLLKYIISDIKLYRESGDHLTVKDMHFIDLDDSRSASINLDSDEYEFVAISFTMGLKNENNSSYQYINYNNTFEGVMAWPEMMGGGYHYMKMEGKFDNDSTFYNTHTGALAMSGMDRMDHSHDFFLDLNPSNSSESLHISINMEINNWYNNPVYTLVSDGIMGNMQAQMDLQANCHDVFSASVR